MSPPQSKLIPRERSEKVRQSGTHLFVEEGCEFKAALGYVVKTENREEDGGAMGR